MQIPGSRTAALAIRIARVAAGFLLYQGAWYACVHGAATGEPGWGIGAAVFVAMLLVAMSSRRVADLKLAALALVVGFAWDSALLRSGIVVYASAWPSADWAPAWIVAIWLLFAPMLREPLRALHRQPIASAFAGAIGGAMSYEAARQLGACAFPNPLLAWATLAAGWALVLPFLLVVARRLDAPAIPAASSPSSALVDMRESHSLHD